MAKIKEEEMANPFARFLHRLENGLGGIVWADADKDHDASPDCWCNPKRTEDGVYMHNRRDN